MTQKKNIYIDRILRVGGEERPQSWLLQQGKVVVVLAEPGAGKTELLENLASSLRVKRLRASLFRHMEQLEADVPLIVDGLDEVAKIDHSAIDAIIVKAAELAPQRVLLASRSAQWEAARSQTVKDAFGHEPIVAYLRPLQDEEQEALFTAYQPSQRFTRFKSSLQVLDVDDLLGNPQMLKTFADAYVHTGGSFSSKRQVFRDAVAHLASEKNSVVAQADRPPNEELIGQADELFCKMLLSGCAGVSATEAASDREFPYVATLYSRLRSARTNALETGLFSPSDNSDQHEPVHRIVAEFSAARYLVKRIETPSDRLSLNRILALVAPNGAVRDELRGLLAWMATEGQPEIEQAVIGLDPYAILSNGDPSKLSVDSKKSLLDSLTDVDEQNPYFRGSDAWRSFSAAGFFTNDIVEGVRTIIRTRSASNQLIGLLLELLHGTQAAHRLFDELNQLLRDPEIDNHCRLLALRNLFELNAFEPAPALLELIDEASTWSLPLAAEIIQHCGICAVGRANTLACLRKIDLVYFPKTKVDRREYRDKFGSKYFISRLVHTFGTEDVVWLLDELSLGLTCGC